MFKRRLLGIPALLLVALALVAAPFSASAETVAKTSPPPIEIRPMTTYTGYTYLQYTNRTLQDAANGTMLTTIQTQAKSTVDQLGGIVQLQQWTGSAWTDVGTATTLTDYNTSTTSLSVSKSATSGYYYRAKVTHFVKEGSVTEQAVEYSSSVLKS